MNAPSGEIAAFFSSCSLVRSGRTFLSPEMSATNRSFFVPPDPDRKMTCLPSGVTAFGNGISFPAAVSVICTGCPTPSGR